MTTKTMRALARRARYRLSYCESALVFLEQGHSRTALAGELGVSLDVLERWERDHPDFAEALAVGEARSVLWWERALLTAVGKGGAATALLYGLKARGGADWKDTKQPADLGPGLADLIRQSLKGEAGKGEALEDGEKGAGG